MINPKVITADGPLSRFVRKHKADKIIFAQGMPGNTMFLVIEGYIRILYDYHHVTHLVGIIGPGEMLGEKAIFPTVQDTIKRDFTAQSKTNVTVLELDKEAFKVLCTQWPDFQMRIMQMIEERLLKANELVGILQSLDPKDRFENYVQYFHKHHCKKLPKGVYVTMTADEIQHAANLEPAFVKTSLEKLVAEDILSVIDDGYVLRDEKALEKLQTNQKVKVAA